MNKKVGRNDPCPCGSGKKYKKCCEQRLGGRKFSASVISSGNKETKATQISADFFSKLSAPKPKEPEQKELEEELPAEEPEEETPKHPPEADKPMEMLFSKRRI